MRLTSLVQETLSSFVREILSSNGFAIAIVMFTGGYAAGVTVDGLIAEELNVTVVVVPNGLDLNKPEYDNHCRNKLGEEITDPIPSHLSKSSFLECDYCTEDTCEFNRLPNSVVDRVDEPDGSHEVQVFRRTKDS